MFALALVPTAFQLAMLLAPGAAETPSWLLGRGQTERAMSTAARLWGSRASVELEARGTGKSVGGGGAPEGGWMDLAAKPHITSTTAVLALFALQQFSGINAIVYFSSSVFRQAGIASDVLASAAVSLVNVLGTALIAAPSIDRFGRKVTTLVRASPPHTH